MQNNTRKKIAPVVVGILVTAVLLPIVLVILAAMGVIRFANVEAIGWVVLPILGVYVLAVGAIIVGVVVAMCQRLKEIDSGEEDEAKKY